MTATVDTLLDLFNFVILTLFFISFIYLVVCKINDRNGGDELPFYSLALNIFPVMLIIIVVRSYIFEPFHIPSESMFPLLTKGDVIYVDKTSYNIKFPLTNLNMVDVRDPERGEVAVFKYPLNMKAYFVKRVIAVPGDRLVWQGDDLYINGHKLQRQPSKPQRKDLIKASYIRYSTEHLGAHAYQIRRLSERDSSRFDINSYFLKMRTAKTLALQGKGIDDHRDYLEITIPEGFYFAMGDNRDESSDSREWGLISRDNFVGRATYNLVNINANAGFDLMNKFNFKYFGAL